MNVVQQFLTSRTDPGSDVFARQCQQSVVEVNFTQNAQPCVQTLDAVRVNVQRPCAASDGSSKPVEHSYRCGRTPNESGNDAFIEHEKFLVQGIVSGKGVFQFVSPKMHFRPDECPGKSIIGALQEKWKLQKPGDPPLLLGGRFLVQSMHPADPPALLPDGVEPQAEDMHRHCQLVVSDLDDPKAGNRVIPLTQAGLKFTDKRLRAEQIMQAHHILGAHQRQYDNPAQAQLRQGESQSLPMIASPAGRGRGPTLITYSEIVERIDAGLITDTPALEAALLDVITEGRKARVAVDAMQYREPDLTGFVHSSEQLDELRSALQQHLTNKIAIDAARSSNAPRPPSAPRSANPGADALSEHRFSLLGNIGGGDCLFHALEGNEHNRSLNQTQVEAVRIKVANVLRTRATNIGWSAEEIARAHRANAQMMASELDRRGIAPASRSMTDNDMAEFQAMSGNYAGSQEFKQWLALPENRDKTLVVLDAKAGDESIGVFTPNYDRQTGMPIFDRKTGMIEIRENIQLLHTEFEPRPTLDDYIASIDAAVYGDNPTFENGVRKIPDNRVVIYRTRGHFERVTGILTDGQIHANLIRQAADNEKLLAAIQRGVDISQLGHDTH